MKLRSFILLLIVLMTSSAFAQKQKDTRASTKNRTRNQLNLIDHRSTSYGLNYLMAADVNEPEPNRLYRQSLEFMLSHPLFESSSMLYKLGMSWGAFSDGELDVEPGKENEVLGDALAVFSHSFQTSNRWRPNISLGAILPTSRHSQDEGFYSRSLISLSGTYLFNNQWVLRISSNNVYTWNRYLTSPITKQFNPMWAHKLGVDLTYIFLETFSVGAGVNIGRIIYTDGEPDFNSGNYLSLSYNSEYWGASLSTSNGNYFGENPIDPFAIDLYRRVVAFSLRWLF